MDRVAADVVAYIAYDNHIEYNHAWYLRSRLHNVTSFQLYLFCAILRDWPPPSTWLPDVASPLGVHLERETVNVRRRIRVSVTYRGSSGAVEDLGKLCESAELTVTAVLIRRMRVGSDTSKCGFGFDELRPYPGRRNEKELFPGAFRAVSDSKLACDILVLLGVLYPRQFQILFGSGELLPGRKCKRDS